MVHLCGKIITCPSTILGCHKYCVENHYSYSFIIVVDCTFYIRMKQIPPVKPVLSPVKPSWYTPLTQFPYLYRMTTTLTWFA